MDDEYEEDIFLGEDDLYDTDVDEFIYEGPYAGEGGIDF